MKNFLMFFVLSLTLIGCSSVRHVQKDNLTGSWMMKSMSGVSLNKEELVKGLPVFNFNVAENRFYGHAGCNQLSSGIVVTDNEIEFGLFISTKMACPDMQVEDAVIRVLSGNTLHYEIKNEKMILTSPDGTVMHFILKQ